MDNSNVMDETDKQDKKSRQDDQGKNLEQILDEQCRKLHQLTGATQLIKSKDKVKDELQRMYDEVSQVSLGVQNLRTVLDKLREQNTQFRKLSSLIETLDKKIIHQTENVPEQLIQSYQNAEQACAQPTSVASCTKEQIKDCKRTLFSEPEICHTIPFITVEEFNKVPKYIIGRQTLDTINSLISAINQTLIAKYTILSWGKATAQKKGEINLYLYYKKQEFDLKQENEYLYFFTAEDYYRQTKTKIDKTKLNLITALRHCKRLRECRIKNELRYVITPR